MAENHKDHCDKSKCHNELTKQDLDELYQLYYTLVGKLDRMERLIMKELDDLKANVTELTTINNSAITLLNGLSQQIADLIQNGTVNPADVQELADAVKADSAAMAAAIVANTQGSSTARK